MTRRLTGSPESPVPTNNHMQWVPLASPTKIARPPTPRVATREKESDVEITFDPDIVRLLRWPWIVLGKYKLLEFRWHGRMWFLRYLPLDLGTPFFPFRSHASGV